jgi:hypothetical protein
MTVCNHPKSQQSSNIDDRILQGVFANRVGDVNAKFSCLSIDFFLSVFFEHQVAGDETAHFAVEVVHVFEAIGKKLRIAALPFFKGSDLIDNFLILITELAPTEIRLIEERGMGSLVLLKL